MAAPTDTIAQLVDVEPIGEVPRVSSEQYPTPARSRITWAGTGMRAQLVTDVAVVRSAKPGTCETCRHRRVLFALTLTAALLGNPERPWRCAPCWGLRP